MADFYENFFDDFDDYFDGNSRDFNARSWAKWVPYFGTKFIDSHQQRQREKEWNDYQKRYGVEFHATKSQKEWLEPGSVNFENTLASGSSWWLKGW